MLQVTPAATQAIQDHFKNKEISPIRIFLKIGGCGMRSLGVAIESIKASDQLFEIDGFTYAINKNILRQFAPIIINSDRYTFLISGKGISPPIGCGTCLFGCGAYGGHRCDGDCANCVKPCPAGLRRNNRARQRIVAG
jgi:iron-sulfur cluster assembly protein